MSYLEEMNMETRVWDSLEVTCVRFPKGDIFGEFLAFLSLAPHVILIAHITLCVFVMDPHVLVFLVGMLANLAFNSGLKRLVGELRPIPTYRFDEHKFSPYGMPSSHSQFIAFFSVYLALYVLVELPHLGSRMETAGKTAFLAFLFALAFLVIYGRVYLIYHTFEQVCYGTALGVLLGFIWFWVTQNLLRPYFPAIRAALTQNMGTRRLRHVPYYAVYLEETSRRKEDIRSNKEEGMLQQATDSNKAARRAAATARLAHKMSGDIGDKKDRKGERKEGVKDDSEMEKHEKGLDGNNTEK